MTTKFKKSFSPMLICWNDIKIHLGFEDSYLVPPPNMMRHSDTGQMKQLKVAERLPPGAGSVCGTKHRQLEANPWPD